jgi:hypothetical protein
MNFERSMKRLAVVMFAVTCGGQVVQAEEYRVVPADRVTACGTGAPTEWMTLDGPRDVSVARADGDTLNVAVCAAEDSKSVVNVRWKANGYWKSSGNISAGCAEILGASKVKLRAVNSNFHEAATYSACVKE